MREELQRRTKQLAISTFVVLKTVRNSPENLILKRQLLRSSSSVASNYRAMRRARSTREFFSKLCVVVEEIDETLFWVDLLVETQTIDAQKISHIRDESLQLLKIFSKTRSTIRRKMSQ